MKLEVKYIKSGTIVVDSPDNWDNMSQRERLEFASEELSKRTDAEIIEGMRETDQRSAETFDDYTEAEAVYDEEHEVIAETNLWYNYVYG